MKNKKIIIIGCVLCIISLGILTSCDMECVRYEQPVLYYKTIQVEVIDVEYQFGLYRRRSELTVYSKEYDLKEKFDLMGLDVNIHNRYRVGDIIDVTLYSQVMESTGEVISRRLSYK